ncbi:MAG: alpha-L-rhamnosidase [Planctomycetota bacterium]
MNIHPPARLRLEYLENPSGVDCKAPRFSWVLEHDDPDQVQTAYRIVVCSSLDHFQKGRGDIWDSGKKATAGHINIRYAGKPLKKHTRYYWGVQWWDRKGKKSPFSESAFFDTGFFEPADWKAKWITRQKGETFRTKGSVLLGKDRGEYIQHHAIYLRKEFHLSKPIRHALAFVCGLGVYELCVNGEKVGDRVLDPGQTDYKKAALYSTYDITWLLGKENALGLILGNGRYIKNYGFGKPRAILQIEILYEDGEAETLTTDGSWRASSGPILENGLYHGEHYDARLEMPGWDSPGFDDSRWEKAKVISGPALASEMMPPIRVTCVLEPQSLDSPKPGSYVFDFGQNFTGWVRLKVSGPRGERVRLRYAELIHENGSLNTAPNQNAAALDHYTLKGMGTEIFEPRFTYHGFRYVEVTGFPGVPSLANLEGCFVHSDVEPAGTFLCDNHLLNRIHSNILWGQCSNLMSVPTDCPQRDERYGWMGDAQLAAEESIFNFDMAAFYTKYLEDIRHAQRGDGALPDVVPLYAGDLYPADPAWGTAYITLAWCLYLYYGDRGVIEMHFSAMKKYVDFLRSQAEGNLLKKLGKYGDWCPPGSVVPKKTPVEITSTFYYYHDTLLLSRMAGAIGKKKVQEQLAKRAERIRKAFNRAYLKKDHYLPHKLAPVDRIISQTSSVLPLALGMVPEDKKAAVLERLASHIMIDQDAHLDTGIVGTRFILEVLTDNGFGELAYRVATQESYPGWGYMIREGATTLWERWEKLTGGGMNSHNHIMLGSIDAWFYKALAGVSPAAPGWRKILVKPHAFEGLDSASATLDTIQGEVHASWQRSPGDFILTVRIPVGVQAEIQLPRLWDDATLLEDGKKIWPKKGQTRSRKVRRKGDRLILRTGSGFYRFAVKR